MKSSPHSRQLEKAHEQQQRHNATKKKNLITIPLLTIPLLRIYPKKIKNQGVKMPIVAITYNGKK